MKNLMMMVLVVGGTLLADASVAKADHHRHGHGGGFSISFGNGYNNFAYSQGRSGYYGYGQPYGGYYSRPVIAVPVYRSYPTYSVPVYGGGYGGGYGGYGGYHRHCH